MATMNEMTYFLIGNRELVNVWDAYWFQQRTKLFVIIDSIHAALQNVKVAIWWIIMVTGTLNG